jgi:hypothetical protein
MGPPRESADRKRLPYASSLAIGSSNFVFNNAIITVATQNVLANSLIRGNN